MVTMLFPISASLHCCPIHLLTQLFYFFVLKQNLDWSILPMKTREPDAGVKERHRKHPADLPPPLTSQKETRFELLLSSRLHLLSAKVTCTRL